LTLWQLHERLECGFRAIVNAKIGAW
jgi:hypothetical protein